MTFPNLYTDDTQIYLPLKVGSEQSLKSLLDCLNELKVRNELKRNERKSEIIIFGPPKFKEKIAGTLALYMF